MIDLVRTQAVAAILAMVLVGSAVVVALPPKLLSSQAPGHGPSPITGASVTVAHPTPRGSVALEAAPATSFPPASPRDDPRTGASGYQLVTFSQQGLVLGTHWYVVITNVGTIQTNQTSVQVPLVAGEYNWTPGSVEGYTSTSGGSFSVGITAIWVTVVYHGLLFTTYPVTFRSPGLPPALVWAVALRSGAYATSANSTITFYETNGSYGWSIGVLPHLNRAPPTGCSP